MHAYCCLNRPTKLCYNLKQDLEDLPLTILFYFNCFTGPKIRKAFAHGTYVFILKYLPTYRFFSMYRYLTNARYATLFVV